MTDVQTTARSAAAGSDRASRLAVAASALRNAVEHGDPFTAELAIVKPLAPDPNAVALLEPFAASGMPGNAALGQELVAIIRQMLRASDRTPSDAGFLERLQANAGKLVRIRPVGEEVARRRPRGCFWRAPSSARHRATFPGALTELNTLPPEARAPLQPSFAKAEARSKALDASRRLAADAVAAPNGTYVNNKRVTEKGSTAIASSSVQRCSRFRSTANRPISSRYRRTSNVASRNCPTPNRRGERLDRDPTRGRHRYLRRQR